MWYKQSLIALLLLIGVIGTGFGQAEINFPETNFDFGEIEEGTTATHEFTFTNTGDQPLILSSVKASCGCTTPSWSKEPILPGKSGHVKASYNSKNRPGSFHKSITITSNATKSSQVVYIKGSAVRSLTQKPLFTPEELDKAPKALIPQPHLQLGKISVGSSIPVQLSIENQGKSPLEIRGVTASCKCLSLMPGKNLVVEPGTTGTLELVFSPITAGEFTHGAFVLTNDLVQPKYQIFITSIIVPPQDQSSVVKEAPSKISF